MAPHSSTLAWKIPWTEEPGRLHAVCGVAESQTRLSDFTFTFHFHALEKEMATHSSVLAWRIPGTEEPGGLRSMGSHRVGHDWSDLAAAAVTMLYITSSWMTCLYIYLRKFVHLTPFTHFACLPSPLDSFLMCEVEHVMFKGHLKILIFELFAYVFFPFFHQPLLFNFKYK